MIEQLERKDSKNKALFTDLYQLKMAAAFVEHGYNTPSVYEVLLRELPQNYGYYVVNGVEQAIDYITNSQVTGSDIDFLRSREIFNPRQLEILREIRFKGDIYAIPEGTPVGPNTPVMSLVADRSENQLAETMALFSIKFPTAVSSKASRIVRAAGGKPVADFSLRDMPSSEASIIGTRAAYIGGFSATSNVEAGRVLDIPITGTMAHAKVMAYGPENERQAFRDFYKSYPESSSFLIDTWDVERGVMNAALVALEMAKNGHKLQSVRIDSGKIGELSIMVRELLDSVGLTEVKILATNELDEYKLIDLDKEGGHLDGSGVGNKIAIAGVADSSFKLVEDAGGIRMKYSAGKIGFPGRKQVWRQFDQSTEKYSYDIVGLWNEQLQGLPLLELVVKNGERVKSPRSLQETRTFSLTEVQKLPQASLLLPKSQAYLTELSTKLNYARSGEIEHITETIEEDDIYELFSAEQRRYAA